ncbi:MAG TPA: hypothetical protein VH351_23290 [Bryobacteraceae bacterium]|jgi:hypothetical protein|nr:hypothetical protein [Bryobacteraceae bacterium]
MPDRNGETSQLSPATSLRLLQRGDQWTYQAIGTLTPPGSNPLELSGEITVSIEPDRRLGRSEWSTIVFSQQFEITQADGSRQAMPAPAWMFWFVQDEQSRDVAIAADNMTRDGSPRIARTPQVFYPGSWSAQTAYHNRLEFENGDVVENMLTVYDQERVETKQGSFASWKATISSHSAATGMIEGMDWWTPELGAPAKFSTVSKMPDGAEIRFVATLETSNVL